jgi:guanosine-3',5'-bis(diphosphate) 3'-pyrophosphohydrolase
MTYNDLFKTEWVQAALDRYKYNTVEDMYASVGFGAISPVKIISRILEEYRKEHKEENIEEKIEELSRVKPNVNKASKTGIIVKGIDNCLVKLSKCCNPLPGDSIVGYITKGRGVSVHRSDCLNIKNLISEENRMIDVAWYDDNKASYHADIEIYANDRMNLLADIIRALSDAKAKLIAVSSKANKEKIAFTEVTLEVENIDELNKVLKALRKVDSVYEVKRRK